MRTTGSIKANYSPIKQQELHSNSQQSDDEIINNLFTSLDLDQNTQTKRLEADERSQQNLNSPFQVTESSRAPVEEVFVYNCCGTTNELNPSIKFLSTYQCSFTAFNFMVFAFGLANFGMGLWFRIDPKVYEIHKYIETQNFTYAGWIILFCGLLACLVALIGCLANEQQLMSWLVIYIFATILLTIAFVSCLVLLTVYGFGQPLEQFLSKEIYEQIIRRSMSTDIISATQISYAAQFIDFIQVKLQCCGAYDFRDYEKLGMTRPTTCSTIEKNVLNAPGCGRALRRLFDLRAGLASSFTLASLIAQLAATVCATLMLCSIYHWRAIPKQQPAPIKTPRNSPGPARYCSETPISKSLHSPLTNLNDLHRPRSRTPIVMKAI